MRMYRCHTLSASGNVLLLLPLQLFPSCSFLSYTLPPASSSPTLSLLLLPLLLCPSWSSPVFCQSVRLLLTLNMKAPKALASSSLNFLRMTLQKSGKKMRPSLARNWLSRHSAQDISSLNIRCQNGRKNNLVCKYLPNRL